MQETESIITLLTPPGQGGISILWLLGQATERLLRSCFKPAKKLKNLSAQRLLYGKIFNCEGEFIDEVVIRRLTPAEALHFGEGYEIGCHGGIAVVEALSVLLESCGAKRLAFRETLAAAVRCGAISAVEYEARRAIRRTASQKAFACMQMQLDGVLQRALEKVIFLLDSDIVTAAVRLRRLLATAPYGVRLLTPMRVLIAGYPNVGKSTLFNRLLSYPRAIVYHTPGTTRDVIGETVLLDGFPVELFDSPGIGTAKDALETASQELAHSALKEADLILFLLDATREINKEERQLLYSLRRRRVMLVINKIDIAASEHIGELEAATGAQLAVSVLQGANIDSLEEAIVKEMGATPPPDDGSPVIFTDRQRRLVSDALRSIEEGDRTAASRLLEKYISPRKEVMG